MALPIPASDIVVGDYSPDYGTVKQVKRRHGETVEVTFVNGTVIAPDFDMEFIIEQGGRFNHGSEGSTAV